MCDSDSKTDHTYASPAYSADENGRVVALSLSSMDILWYRDFASSAEKKRAFPSLSKRSPITGIRYSVAGLETLFTVQ